MAGYSAFWGQGPQTERFDIYDPKQKSILDALAAMGFGGIQNNPMDLQHEEDRARNMFTTQTVPGLLERLEGMGALNSSALGGQLGGAAAQLESDIKSQRNAYSQQNFNNMLQLLGIGLQPQQNVVASPASTGIAGNFASGLGQTLPDAIASIATGGLSGIGKLLTQFAGKTQSSTGSPISGMQGNTGGFAPNGGVNPWSVQQILKSSYQPQPPMGNPFSTYGILNRSQQMPRYF